MSLVVSFLVAIAVLVLVVGAASILVHPHVCSLMQGDWSVEPDGAAPTRHT